MWLVAEDESVKHRGVLVLLLKLAYLLQIDLPENQTEDLGRDLFMLDFTQVKWHASSSVEQAKDAYIA